jgi:HD superfamily phosphodiesterase
MKYSAAKKFILEKLEKELSPELTYHGFHHTIDVLEVAAELCGHLDILPEETILVKTAALFHDSGFTVSNVNHEETGCQIARDNLPRYGYTEENIEKICGMIMATKIPQTPKTPLEEILADADLDYLGRNDFKPIGDTLFDELKTFNVIQTEEDWNRLQIRFLEGHGFFTSYNLKHRQPIKMAHLAELKEIVNAYS